MPTVLAEAFIAANDGHNEFRYVPTKDGILIKPVKRVEIAKANIPDWLKDKDTN